MERIRVALVEDHKATHEALQQTLWDYSSRIELVAIAPDAETFLRSGAQRSIDVALFDLGLPGMNGCAAIQSLEETQPQVRSLALSAYDDEDTVLDAIRAGACGYLLKDEPA